jgi:imidazole glycerol phosphate synthase glutamine amidotransferase subunit
MSSSRSRLLVVPTGAANLAAVFAAFRRIGTEPVLSSDPDRIRAAKRVVLPGVGAFGPARVALAESGADEALLDRTNAEESTLGICLGMHLFAEGSQEAEGEGGLGLLPGVAERFDASVRVPQMGWNRVETAQTQGLLRSGDAYFANSFRLSVPGGADGWTFATADHGGAFLAAAERSRTLVCQFHPELSGPYGASLLQRWYEEGSC